MKNEFKEINLTVGLDDNEGVEYYFYEDDLTLIIINWELKRIKISFFDVIFFVDWGLDSNISKFVQNINIEKLMSISQETVERMVGNSDYQLFQLIDTIGESCFEVVCKDFQIQIDDKTSINKPNGSHLYRSQIKNTNSSLLYFKSDENVDGNEVGVVNERNEIEKYIFQDTIAFLFRSKSISKLILNEDISPLLEVSVLKNCKNSFFETVFLEGKKLLQFINFANMPSIEIVCKNFDNIK